MTLHAGADVNDYQIEGKRDCSARHKGGCGRGLTDQEGTTAGGWWEGATGLGHEAGAMELVKHRESQPSCPRICARYDALESVKKARSTLTGKEAATHLL